MTKLGLFHQDTPIDNVSGANNYYNYDSDYDNHYQSFRILKNDNPRDEFRFFVLPYWVKDQFKSSNYDYMKLNDYDSLLKITTENDRLFILALSALDSITNSSSPASINIKTITDTWAASAPDGFKVPEYYNLPYLDMIDYSKEIAITRLSKDFKDTMERPYQFFNTANNLVLILDCSFFNFITNKDNKLVFYRSLLKEIHTKLPLSRIVGNSRYALWFKTYLELLK